jgi:preprotein translocase subunit SecD
VYFLYPTWKDSQHQKQLKTLGSRDSARYFDENEKSIRDSRGKRLKLGLDLQGGMYVTLEVSIGDLLDKLARNKDETFFRILESTKEEAKTSGEPIISIFRRRFDEQNLNMSRYYGDMRDKNGTIESYLSDEAKKAIDRAEQIIRNRVDQYGVSEVSIQKTEGGRIIIELPGVKDEKDVWALIQETALLEFKLFADSKLVLDTFERLDKVMLGAKADSLMAVVPDTARAGKDSTQLAKADSIKRADSIRNKNLTEDQFKREHPFQAMFIGTQYGIYAEPEQKEKINNILRQPEMRRVIPDGVKFAWSAKSRKFDETGGTEYFEFYALKGQPELTGEVVTNARATTDQQSFGGAVVHMEMNDDGARRWARITEANIKKPIAIVLDNAVFSAPVVQQKIPNGSSQISGMDNMEEARLLEIVLKAGALPAPVEIIEERTVGPSLGEDSIAKGFNSFLIGTGLVVIFMIFYYRFSGVTADIAVIFNVWFILGILAAFHATLSLPGIAGMLLTVGMAVDANVLINERIREELAVGKTLRGAIDSGYSRAMPAIIDSNLTTLITCIILMVLGTGPIQGFAVTLTIGITCSLFTAIVMTRVIIELVLDKRPALIAFG